MDANECKLERFSSRTVGLLIVFVSFLLLTIGLVVLPVFGFIFAFPLLLLGGMMVVAPESTACRKIRKGLKI